MLYNVKKHICAQICAENEWKAVKEILKIGKSNISNSPYGEYVNFPLEDFVFDSRDYACILFNSGATKTLAAGACQFAISKWKPEIIFVLGTAGGVSDKLKPLDLVIACDTIQYDCISRMGSNSNTFHFEFHTQLDNEWIYWPFLDFKLNEGAIATADQDINFEIKESLKAHNICAADWESGAIAPVCKLNNVQCCVIRGISDIPLNIFSGNIDEQFNQFTKNTPIIMEKLIRNIFPGLLKMYSINIFFENFNKLGE